MAKSVFSDFGHFLSSTCFLKLSVFCFYEKLLRTLIYEIIKFTCFAKTWWICLYQVSSCSTLLEEKFKIQNLITKLLTGMGHFFLYRPK